MCDLLLITLDYSVAEFLCQLTPLNISSSMTLALTKIQLLNKQTHFLIQTKNKKICLFEKMFTCNVVSSSLILESIVFIWNKMPSA